MHDIRASPGTERMVLSCPLACGDWVAAAHLILPSYPLTLAGVSKDTAKHGIASCAVSHLPA